MKDEEATPGTAVEPPKLLIKRPTTSRAILSHCSTDNTLLRSAFERTADQRILELYKMDLVCAPTNATPPNSNA
jgi:hypothetical protein